LKIPEEAFILTEVRCQDPPGCAFPETTFPNPELSVSEEESKSGWLNLLEPLKNRPGQQRQLSRALFSLFPKEAGFTSNFVPKHSRNGTSSIHYVIFRIWH
jgi:hypothetical protein